MAGDIYIGFDSTQAGKPVYNDGYVDSRTFRAFGDILNEALLEDFPDLLEKIKVYEPMAMYNFVELSNSEFNSAIAALRKYMGGLKSPTDWQQVGIWAWNEVGEPATRKDERYDFAFHGETPPAERAG